MKNFLPFRTRLYFLSKNKNFLTNFAMQLLIFFSTSHQRSAPKKRLRFIDSLNIIPFTKNIVKRFFQPFLIFFYFFHFFHKSGFLYSFFRFLGVYIYYMSRDRKLCQSKKRAFCPFRSVDTAF